MRVEEVRNDLLTCQLCATNAATDPLLQINDFGRSGDQSTEQSPKSSLVSVKFSLVAPCRNVSFL